MAKVALLKLEYLRHAVRRGARQLEPTVLKTLWRASLEDSEQMTSSSGCTRDTHD